MQNSTVAVEDKGTETVIFTAGAIITKGRVKRARDWRTLLLASFTQVNEIKLTFDRLFAKPITALVEKWRAYA